MPLPTDEAFHQLRLSLVVGLSPRAQRALVDRYGSASEVMTLPADLEEFAGPAAMAALTRGASPHWVERAIQWSRAPTHHLLGIDDPRYPVALRQVADAPLVLYARGRVDLLASACFAIVGSRNATAQGREDAYAFARFLSDSGLCIVSGLAHGIDSAAHLGGLDGRSSSIAVIGTGHDIVYPRGNCGLAARLSEHGCVITEFFFGTPPVGGNFLRRNRLISGLVRGVLVVEANQRSGSLSTARHANEQGRDVFALPGSIHSTLSKGCHKLIKEGATLVEDANDILFALGLQTVAPMKRARRPRSHPVLSAMGFDPVSMDLLSERTGMAAPALAAELAVLEVDGVICALPGGRFQRIEGPA